MKALLLEPSHEPSSQSFIPMSLKLYDIEPKTPIKLDEVSVISGTRGAQRLSLAADSPTGSGEPVPEGRYWLGDPDTLKNGNGINWASGQPGVYSGTWGPGLGPAWIGVHPMKGLITARSSIGIHLDENWSTSPGSAGCIVAITLERLKMIHKWFIGHKDWPQILVVDYNLGSVGEPFPDWLKKAKRL
jgi:hypothetical protein